jgi:hypothetical protein
MVLQRSKVKARITMEQDERLYEYKMGSEVYRFEARNHAEALELRGSAIQYFAEHLATLFSEDALVGPELAEMPKDFSLEERAAPGL